MAVWNRTPLALRPSVFFFCAEGYVTSDNVDGGGEDVCEKNEIISVVTTKKGRREISYYNRFVCTQTLIRWSKHVGAAWKKQASRDKRKAIHCVLMRFMHWGRNSLKFYVFPLASLRFYFYRWIPGTRRGEVKTHSYTLRFGGGGGGGGGFKQR